MRAHGHQKSHYKNVHNSFVPNNTKLKTVQALSMQIIQSPDTSGTPRAVFACHADCKLRPLGCNVAGIVVLIL